MPAPHEPLSVAKLQDADMAALLGRLSTREMIEGGALNVIGLDAVRAALGDRWARRQGDVWAYVERCVDKHLSHQDVCHRINDTDFVIAMTSDNGLVAQTICMRILEEVITHFMGGCNTSDLVIKAVKGVSGGEIVCAEVDVAQVSARIKQGLDAPTPNPAAPSRNAAASPSVVSLSTASGRELTITHYPSQLFSLAHGVVAGVRCEPLVASPATGKLIARQEFQRLADTDLAAIDMATIAMGVAVARQVPSDRPGIILPLSFQSLASGRTRASLMASIPEGMMRTRFLVEITNLDSGTPNGRLMETVALLKAHTTAVMARVPPHRGAIAPLADCRLAAIALDLAESVIDERMSVAVMEAFVAHAIGLAASLHVLGLASKDLFAPAKKAGLTHASVRRPSASLAA